jgi:hypothetical protein
MTSPTPDPSTATPPDWPHCGHGATPDDPVGCRGIHVNGHTACLAHLEETDLIAYLDGLAPGADIDHRGTTFTEHLLDRLLDALQNHLGNALFARATFTGDAGFARATFTGRAAFEGASFTGHAGFDNATFATRAWFGGATFSGGALFSGATFSGPAWFGGVTFSGPAGFEGVTFSGHAGFGGVTFSGHAGFRGARFETEQRVGPLVCGGQLDLGGAMFGAPVMVEAAALKVSLRWSRWASTAALRLRYAEVDLSGAVLEYPLTLAAEPAPFTIRGGDSVPEDVLAGRDQGVRTVAVSGVDCAHLTLTDVDLTGCRFASAVHLDQLRLDGRVRFDRPPAGWRRLRLLPARWSQRRTLAEEHHWRAAAGSQVPGAAPAAGSWRPGPHHPDLELTPGPETVSAIYRQLRKALEDGKNEPDAADFYYGEMEMRRHDATRPRAERWLLAAYWAVSGYGLRASRALAWLGVAMAVTVAALMLWGLPVDDPKPTTTGRQDGAGQYLETTDTPDPENPTGPLQERVTTDRFEKALRVVINSTVFRSSGQDLTTAGTYTEMTSRFAEPVLLALAVLAVRARVKR